MSTSRSEPIMSQKLTRKGARNFTELVDRVAEIAQKQASALGLPERVALDFAKRCDLISDAVELTAAANFPLPKEASEDEESEDEESDKTEGKKSAAAGKDEEGMSVEPDGEGYDANAIADEKGGPLQSEGDEPYMKGEFNQERFHQLGDKQKANGLAGVDGKLAASLKKLAAVSDLSALSDEMKLCAAKLGEMKGVPASIVSDVKKQVQAIDKVRDALIRMEATGEGSVDLVAAGERIAQAVSEQLPHLRSLEGGVDEGSPSAVLAFEERLGTGTLQKLIAIGAKIVMDASKASGGSDKEASAKKSEDAESDEEACGEMAEDGKESGKKAAEDEESDDSEGQGKQASVVGGINLFE
jgi:hypothetical protein